MEKLDLQWRVHVKNLFEEIYTFNKDLHIVERPLQVTFDILNQIALRAAELEDEKLIQLACRLTLYTFTDPEHEDYNKEQANHYLSLKFD